MFEEITDELKSKLMRITALSMVRMHNVGEIDLYQIETHDHLQAVLEQVGLDDKNPFEIYVTSERSRLESAKLCLKSGDPESALVIVSSFIESEINTLIRLALRLRNFSHGVISDSLKGTDLRTKMNVIIPLLQIKMSERQKQIAIEQNKVRNIILHFKATPNISHDEGTSESDFDKVKNQVEAFFIRHPVDSIEECFSLFVDYAISEQPHVLYAYQLFERINA
jgi:hypothetical protein